MRRLAAVALTGLVSAAASLFCAGPALADVAPQPAVAGVVVLALIVLGVIVIGVVVVSLLVLRGISRSRRKRLIHEENAERRAAKGAGDAGSDPLPPEENE